MKKECLVCGFVADGDLHCCPACGQGTWVVLDGGDEKVIVKKPAKSK